MIDIVSQEEKIIKRLKELESDYNRGMLSKNDFLRQKRYLSKQLETLEVADRVRRLQGKQGSEKSLDYWSEKEKEKKGTEDLEEKEELLKKYSTKPLVEETTDKGILSSRTKIIISIILIVGFLVGTAFGVSMVSKPSESPKSMVVNDTAFPLKNITNLTKNTTTTKKIYYTNRTRLINRTITRTSSSANNSTTK